MLEQQIRPLPRADPLWMAYHEGDIENLWPSGVTAFAHVVAVADGMAVIADHNQQCILQHPQDPHGLVEMTKPAITHSDQGAKIDLGAPQ